MSTAVGVVLLLWHCESKDDQSNDKCSKDVDVGFLECKRYLVVELKIPPHIIPRHIVRFSLQDKRRAKMRIICKHFSNFLRCHPRTDQQRHQEDIDAHKVIHCYTRMRRSKGLD